MIIFFIIGLFLILTVILFLSFCHVIQVSGDSMCPTYFDGEFLFAIKIFRPKKLKVGDVVIFNPPDTDNKKYFAIKRIDDVTFMDGKFYFYLLGDNRRVSYDSRRYGYVSQDRLKAKVIQKEDVENVKNFME